MDDETKPPEPRPPAAGPLDKVIDDLSEAVRATLEGPSVNKFAEASRLCQIGHQLQRAKAESLDDFAALEQNGYAQGGMIGNVVYANNAGANMIDMAPIQGPRRRVANARGPQVVGVVGNAADDYALADPQTRRLLLMLEPLLQVQRGTQAAQAAQFEAEELRDLLTARGEVGEAARAVIERRIEALVENIETRNAARAIRAPAEVEPVQQEREKNDAEPALVLADVPRGHLVGAQNGANHHPPGLRADGGGGEGPGGAA